MRRTFSSGLNLTLPEMPKDPKPEHPERDLDAGPSELTLLTLAVAAAIVATLGAIAAQVF
ncbi:MAG: hypothetical protein Tsb0019_30240 [Roseibium sp.]